MPKVWLRKPDTCRPLNQPCSAAPPPEASGRTEPDCAVIGNTAAVALVTLRESPEVTVRPAASAREPSDKTKAKVKSAADFATPPPETPTAGTLVPIELPPYI